MLQRYLLFILFSVTLVCESQAQQDHYKFIENKGQWHPNVEYMAQIPGGTIYLENAAFTYKFQDISELIHVHTNPQDYKPGKNGRVFTHVVRTEFLNANSAQLSGEQKGTEYYNYFIGNDPSRWASNIYPMGKVKYANVYNQIDLQMYTLSNQLKYDWIVKPGGDHHNIQIKYTGQEKILLKHGDLIIKTSLGKIMEQAPFAYQVINGKVKVIRCDYVLQGDILTFDFPDGYNSAVDLIIDPTLIFSTSSGSTANNFGMTATYDLNGNLYSGGTVFNNGFPTTTGAYDSTFAGTPGAGITDIAITKYNDSGTNQIYSTYIGGDQCETVHSLIINDQDEIFLFGLTGSTNFPTHATAYDQTFAGGTAYNSVPNGTNFVNGTDLFVSKLSNDGTMLLGSTYVGGSLNDGINYNDAQVTSNLAYDSLLRNYGDQFRGEVMVDDLGNCYIATCSRSADFPIIGGFGTTLQGGQAGVVMKFDPNLDNLTWSTFLNGENKDAAYAVKVDENYDVYVVGGTSSTLFPVTTGVYQNTYGGGIADGFICKIKSDASGLIHSTFLGTNSYDQAYFLEYDRHGKLHILGQTLGPASFPITSGVYNNPNSSQFVTSMDSTLSALEYSTIFGSGGGVIDISPSAFLIDVCGNIYISGWGANILQGNPIGPMPVTANAWSTSSIDGFGFYLLVLDRFATGLLYGTYYGGNLSQEHVDGGTSRFDPNGIVYQSVCAGCQNNDDFPCTPGAWSCDNLSTGCNNGVFKFDFEIKPVADFTVDVLSGCAPLTVSFTNSSLNNTNYLWDFGNGDTTSIQPSPVRTYTDTGTFYVYLAIEDSICALVDTALQIITVYPELQLSTSNDTIICDTSTFDIWASAFGHDGNYIWSSDNQFSDTLNPILTDSALNVTVLQPGYYYVQVSNPYCDLMDSVFIDFTANALNLPLNIAICDGQNGTIAATGGNPLDPIISYDWEADSIIVSGDGTNSIDINPSTSQYVYLTAISAAGCIIFDSVYVTVDNFGTGINAYADMDSIAFGGSTGIHVTPSGFNYSWSSPGDFLDPNSANTIVTPSNFGLNTYYVTVTNGACTRIDTVLIYTFELICDEPDIFVPNAFTPNNDGNNDVLSVRANNLTEVYFTVYDRWGEQVFETNDINLGWDGIFKGKMSDPDVYVYYLTGLCVEGQEFFKKGNVTLIK